jgi:hypothetical protein
MLAGQFQENTFNFRELLKLVPPGLLLETSSPLLARQTPDA